VITTAGLLQRIAYIMFSGSAAQRPLPVTGGRQIPSVTTRAAAFKLAAC
jgi:hypothetical protein